MKLRSNQLTWSISGGAGGLRQAPQTRVVAARSHSQTFCWHGSPTSAGERGAMNPNPQEESPGSVRSETHRSCCFLRSRRNYTEAEAVAACRGQHSGSTACELHNSCSRRKQQKATETGPGIISNQRMKRTWKLHSSKSCNTSTLLFLLK